MRCVDALVVDDNPEAREAIAEALATMGYTIVRQAENGATALTLLAARVPDLLVLDLEMPLMSGRDVLRWVRRHRVFDGMAVVVVSADPAPPPPLVKFVSKTSSLDEVLAAVRAATTQRAR